MHIASFIQGPYEKGTVVFWRWIHRWIAHIVGFQIWRFTTNKCDEKKSYWFKWITINFLLTRLTLYIFTLLKSLALDILTLCYEMLQSYWSRAGKNKWLIPAKSLFCPVTSQKVVLVILLHLGGNLINKTYHDAHCCTQHSSFIILVI